MAHGSISDSRNLKLFNMSLTQSPRYKPTVYRPSDMFTPYAKKAESDEFHLEKQVEFFSQTLF